MARIRPAKMPSDTLRASKRRSGAHRSSISGFIGKGHLGAARKGRVPREDTNLAGDALSPARSSRPSWMAKAAKRASTAASVANSVKPTVPNGSEGDDSAENAIGLQAGRGVADAALSGVRTSAGEAVKTGMAARKGATRPARRGEQAVHRAERNIRTSAGEAVRTARRHARRAAAHAVQLVRTLVGVAGGPMLMSAAAVMSVALVLVAVLSWTVTSKEPDRSNVPQDYQEDVERAGTVCNVVTSPLIAAQIEAESNWNPRAASPAGAQGIAQFMPGTWASVGIDGDGDGKADVWNPADAIWSQAHYMCSLADKVQSYIDQETVHGDVVDLALAAYNAGPGAVLSAGGMPSTEETRSYVARIKSLMVKYGGEGGAPGEGAGQLIPPLVMSSDGWHVDVAATGTDEGAAPTYGRFQCTWWAAIRRAQVGRPVDPHMGNGAQWADKARSLGWQVSSKPSSGDVMCFQGGVHGSSLAYGHVAVVEAVNDDGSILISQSGTGWMAVVTETISVAQLASFGEGVSFIK